jgi:serine phosphatase RsbU (regulator of sigma subunit)
MSAKGEEYGRERLARAVLDTQGLSAREMIARLHKDVIDWTEGQGADDDITFFIIKAL